MKYFILVAGLIFLSSCSSLSTKHKGSVGKMATDSDDEIVQIPVDPDEPNVLPIDADDGSDTEQVTKEDGAGDETVANAEDSSSVLKQLDEKSFISLKNYPNIPHHYNRYVQKWLDYFQGKGSKVMARYLERSGKYLPQIRKILRDNGLPEDLAYIALIESGFTYSARSHAGAVGLWQFISPTGKHYGLQINPLVDERKDPIKATQAAVRYFRSLYNVFGNWYFAFAAYNSGENRMFRALMKHDSRDFWTLAEAKKLPKETVNYIPKFLAARMIAKNPERYGFTDLQYEEEIPYSEVVASKTVNLKTMAQNMGIDYKDLKDLNSQFNSEFAPVINGKTITLKVPSQFTDKATLAMTQSYVEGNRWIASVQNNDTYRYRVRHGDSLYKIARRHNTTVVKLRKMNNLGQRSSLRVGQYIKVPESYTQQKKLIEDLRRSLKDTQTAKRDPQSSRHKNNPKAKYVVVRRGDTLTGIAKKYNISLNKILSMNGKLKSRSKLVAGTKLTLFE